jgi:hypothetical protein
LRGDRFRLRLRLTRRGKSKQPEKFSVSPNSGLAETILRLKRVRHFYSSDDNLAEKDIFSSNDNLAETFLDLHLCT